MFLAAPAFLCRAGRVRLLVVAFAMLMSFPVDADRQPGLSADRISTALPAVVTCGRGCRCSHGSTVANCSYANLVKVPQFPSSTRVLVLDWNHIGRFGGKILCASTTPPSLPTSTGNGNGNGSTLSPSRLEQLSASHNNVSEIAATALRGCSALRQLRLDNNRIERLPAAMFADTLSLSALSLSGNRHLDMASVGAALTPTRLPLLRLLDLSKIDTIGVDGRRLPETVFSQLPALEHLILRDVVITNMSAEFFVALSVTSLATLDLSGSSIGEVNETAFEPLAAKLEHLILDRAIISPSDLEAVFAGLAAKTNDTQLSLLSLRNVFVDDGHEASVGQHLFRHLVTAR